MLEASIGDLSHSPIEPANECHALLPQTAIIPSKLTNLSGGTLQMYNSFFQFIYQINELLPAHGVDIAVPNH